MMRAGISLSVLALVGLGSLETEQPGEAVRIVEPELDARTLEYRRSLPEAPPPLRGFRLPSLDEPSKLPPFVPDAQDDAPLRKAVTRVVQELAREGLLATLVRTVDALGAETVDSAARLETAGLPVDLLPFFTWEGADNTRDPDVWARTIAERLASGATVEELVAELASAQFDFRPSGFRAASESGERDANTIRLQLTRGDTWLGDGDGSNIDLARQVIQALPDADVLASVEGRNLDELLTTLEGWELGDRADRLTLIREALVVAQWAQDNGKAGYVSNASGTRTIATLVPRYACRGEGGSLFVPGETFVAESLAATGHTVLRSPLLFQGGNLLVAHDPAHNERVMLAGEAEVYRNVALGLTEEQALTALRIEFGVDRCVVLPAASFHIDAEVSLRTHEGALLAFVNDDAPAISIMLEETLAAFARAEKVEAEDAERGRAAIAASDWATVIEVLGGVMGANALSVGVYPESFARVFESEATDPGTANLQSFLLALDSVTCEAIPVDQVPDRHAQAYLRSFQRRTEDRRAIRDELERNGWRVVPVPSLAGGSRGRNYINAVHDRTRSLVPVYGGLFERLDRAALDVYERTLGSAVTVVPIRSSESQRRSGAVHCSVALYPEP